MLLFSVSEMYFTILCARAVMAVSVRWPELSFMEESVNFM